MEIGRRLRELRAVKGLSQGHIEKRTGLFRCYVSRVECGHTVPSLETLEKWVKALDLELYQLFFQDDRKPKAPEVAKSLPLDDVEDRFLRVFRDLRRQDRQLLLSMARKMVKQQRLDK